MKRFGQLIKIRPEYFNKYKKYHADVWPEINNKILECNIRNYSIFHKDGLLFAYFEYIGINYDTDMRKMAEDPKTQEWWKIMEPMQQPVENKKEDEWWAKMEEIYHID